MLLISQIETIFPFYLPPKRLWIESNTVLTSYADDHLSWLHQMLNKINTDSTRVKRHDELIKYN